MEILEVEEKLAEYQIIQQKEKIQSSDKKKMYMKMMLDNIELQNMKLRQQSEEDLRMSNLVNTKEILLMDKMEKIRIDQTKLLKLKDDQMNRTCGF
jgi:hypothetical protein